MNRAWFSAGNLVRAAMLLTAGLVLLMLKTCSDINDFIDRCDDVSSDKYIQDEAERAAACGRSIGGVEP